MQHTYLTKERSKLDNINNENSALFFLISYTARICRVVQMVRVVRAVKVVQVVQQGQVYWLDIRVLKHFLKLCLFDCFLFSGQGGQVGQGCPAVQGGSFGQSGHWSGLSR